MYFAQDNWQDNHTCIFLRHVWVVLRHARLRSSIRATALRLAGYRSSMSFLRAVKAEERTDVTSRTRGNVFLLPSRSAFSVKRYFAKEFNEELPHNFQLRSSSFPIWRRIFMNFCHLVFTSRLNIVSLKLLERYARTYLKSGNDVCWRNRRVCQW